jgi:hypothetical protein
MTFQTTVTDPDGVPVQGLLVIGNDMITGETFLRSTDGAGYADVAMLGRCQAGDAASLTVLDPQYRFLGTGQYHTLGGDQVIRITVVPFG